MTLFSIILKHTSHKFLFSNEYDFVDKKLMDWRNNKKINSFLKNDFLASVGTPRI